jgi:iron(III) transport system substrate-binding protein
VADKDVPRKWEDLLDPKWKGKIAILSSGAEFDMLLTSMDESKLVDYLKQLAPQTVPIKTQAEALNKVATGEAWITNAATTILVADQVGQGAPLALAPLPAQETPNGFFTVKGTPHLNAAELFISWAASPEQKSALAGVGLGRYQNCGPLKTDQLLCNKNIDILYVDTPEKADHTVSLRPAMVKALGLSPS